MNAKLATGFLLLAFGLLADPGPNVRAQQPAAPKDEALDSLLEKLSDPSDNPKSSKSDKPEAAKPDAMAKKDQSKGAGTEAKAKAKGKSDGASDKAKPAPKNDAPAAKGDKPAAKKPGESPEVSGKDQELDDLLQKLGETKETPAPDDRPKGPPGGGDDQKGQQPSQPGKTERDKLTGKDKETDEHLEELTGRKRKRNSDNGQRSGEVGEMIKEMRDVEQKLGKPDTGEGTRQQQKKIVKRIETMIEQAKKSGSAMGQMSMRRAGNRPGQQPGQQGQQPGAMAQGVGPMKPKHPDRQTLDRERQGYLGTPPAGAPSADREPDAGRALERETRVDRAILSLGRQGQARPRGVRSCSRIGVGGSLRSCLAIGGVLPGPRARRSRPVAGPAQTRASRCAASARAVGVTCPRGRWR